MPQILGAISMVFGLPHLGFLPLTVRVGSENIKSHCSGARKLPVLAAPPFSRLYGEATSDTRALLRFLLSHNPMAT